MKKKTPNRTETELQIKQEVIDLIQTIEHSVKPPELAKQIVNSLYSLLVKIQTFTNAKIQSAIRDTADLMEQEVRDMAKEKFFMKWKGKEIPPDVVIAGYKNKTATLKGAMATKTKYARNEKRWLKTLQEYCRDNPNVLITQARADVGELFGVTSNTVKKYTGGWKPSK